MNLAFTRYTDGMGFTKHKELLETWLKYYSQYFDKLVVFGHQDTGIPTDLKEKYEFDYVHTEVEMHSVASLYFLTEKQTEFLKDYEWVLYTDMDEIVIADPRKYKDLKDFMDKSDEKQTYCEGYELYKGQDERPIDRWKPIMPQRKYWWRSVNGSYNKPALSRTPSKWVHGFHSLEGETADFAKGHKDTGLYLIHMRHVDEQFDLTSKTNEGGIAEEMPDYMKGTF
jgi:hypothetical protein